MSIQSGYGSFADSHKEYLDVHGEAPVVIKKSTAKLIPSTGERTQQKRNSLPQKKQHEGSASTKKRASSTSKRKAKENAKTPRDKVYKGTKHTPKHSTFSDISISDRIVRNSQSVKKKSRLSPDEKTSSVHPKSDPNLPESQLEHESEPPAVRTTKAAILHRFNVTLKRSSSGLLSLPRGGLRINGTVLIAGLSALGMGALVLTSLSLVPHYFEDRQLAFEVSNPLDSDWTLESLDESLDETIKYQQSSRLPPLPPLSDSGQSDQLGDSSTAGYIDAPEVEYASLGKASRSDAVSRTTVPRQGRTQSVRGGYLKRVIQKVYSQIASKASKKVDPIDLTSIIVSESLRAEIDPLFITAVIKTESTFNTKAVSYAGARGLMQIMPNTKTHIEKMESIRPEHRRSIHDPRYNIKLGIAYIKYLLREFDGNKGLALMAYNWGPGSVQRTLKGKRSGGVPKSVMKYAVKILNDHSNWQSQVAEEIMYG